MNDKIAALQAELHQTRLAYLMAIEIGRFKSGFLARTAHELRSPLSSLIGLHQIVLSDLCENPQEEKEFIAQSYQAAQQFLKILDELIAISKLDYGAIALEIRPVRLTQIFAELLQLTSMQAKNRRIELAIAPVASDSFVVADYDRFLQLLVYLVDSSISYLREGWIRVSADVEGCIDIDCPSDIWHEPIDLFDTLPKFQTTVKPPADEIASLVQTMQLSSGMKLWVAHSLLEAMGGRLKVLELSSQDSDRKTTRLRCLLPLATAEMVALELAED